MPRRPVDWYWRERVYTIVANDPKRGPRAIAEELEREAKEIGRTDWPSERTVGRLKERFFKEKSAEARAEYEYAYWPEAMERGLLPWEAGEALMDLHRHAVENGGRRPSVRLARWYWRMQQVAPEAPTPHLLWFAARMAVGELMGEHPGLSRRIVEAALLKRYWETVPDEPSRVFVFYVPHVDALVEKAADDVFHQAVRAVMAGILSEEELARLKWHRSVEEHLAEIQDAYDSLPLRERLAYREILEHIKSHPEEVEKLRKEWKAETSRDINDVVRDLEEMMHSPKFLAPDGQLPPALSSIRLMVNHGQEAGK